MKGDRKLVIKKYFVHNLNVFFVFAYSVCSACYMQRLHQNDKDIYDYNISRPHDNNNDNDDDYQMAIITFVIGITIIIVIIQILLFCLNELAIYRGGGGEGRFFVPKYCRKTGTHRGRAIISQASWTAIYDSNFCPASIHPPTSAHIHIHTHTHKHTHTHTHTHIQILLD